MSTTPPTPVPPSTEKEQQTERIFAGQRRVNIIWEVTQALIAIAVVTANLAVAVHTGLNESKVDVPPTLTNALFLVVGFYFSRTNHTAVGGIGERPHNTQRNEEGR